MKNDLIVPNIKFLENTYCLNHLRIQQEKNIQINDILDILSKKYDFLIGYCETRKQREELDIVWEMIKYLNNNKPVSLEQLELCYKPKLIEAGMSDTEANSSLRTLMPLSILSHLEKLIEIDFQLSVIVDLIIHDSEDIYAIYIARGGGYLFSIDNGIEWSRNLSKRSSLIYPRGEDLYSQFEQTYVNVMEDSNIGTWKYNKLKEEFISITKLNMDKNKNFQNHAQIVFKNIIDTGVFNSGRKRIRFIDTFGRGVTALNIWAIFECLKNSYSTENIISEPFELKIQKPINNFPSISDWKGRFTDYAYYKRYDEVLHSYGIHMSKLRPLEWKGHPYEVLKGHIGGAKMKFWPAGQLLSELKSITCSVGVKYYLSGSKL